MLNNYLNRPRRKAWIGAAIGAAVGIGSTLFGASKQKKAQEEQFKLQQAMEARNTGLTSAANMTQAYANADELAKEFRSRFMRMGGRKKCEGGGWTSADTESLINSLGSAGSNLATSIVGKAQQNAIYPSAVKPIVSTDKTDAVYDSANRSQMLNDYYRVSSLRCGGGRKMGRR